MDIEHALAELESARNTYQAMLEQKTLAGWLLQKSAFKPLTGQQLELGNINNALNALRVHMSRLYDQINEQVYEIYSVTPPFSTIQQTWGQLLKELLSIDDHVEVVTTNYDLVIEEAIHRGNLS